jgi:adenylosuccinate lyase
MSRVDADEDKIKQELDGHWEVISEGAQTILRAAGRSDAYESLKSQMQGRVLNESSYRGWAESLDVDEEVRTRLLELTPELYIGLAIQLVDEVIEGRDKTSRRQEDTEAL